MGFTKKRSCLENAPFFETSARRRYCLLAGRKALSSVEKSYNDPLASLHNLEAGEALDGPQSALEFLTDMQERNPEAGFQSTEVFSDVGDDFISSNGRSLRMTLYNGLIYADLAVKNGQLSEYALARERARFAEYSHVREWADTGYQGRLVISSLCPDSAELSRAESIRLNFQQDRLRSSMAVYHPPSQGSPDINVEFFSIDGHSLDSHRHLLQVLGVSDPVPDTTLELLGGSCVYQPKDSSLSSKDEFRALHGQQDSATAHGPRMQNAYDQWKRLNMLAYDSIDRSEASSDLIDLARRLGLAVGEGYFSAAAAAEVLDLYRLRVAPSYIYGQRPDIFVSIGESVTSMPSYAGACPEARGGANLSAESSDLMNRYQGYGRCQSCSANGSLYGCGVFCFGCNKLWCVEYATTGRQLSYQEVSRARRFRSSFWSFLV